MTKYRKLAAVIFAGSLVLAACGDDDDDDTTATTASAATDAPATEAPGTEAPSTEAPSTDAPSTEAPSTEASSSSEAASSSEATADSGMAAAQANVDKFSTPDGTIGVTIPLTGVPEKKTIAWMECDVPTCAAYLTPGMKDATAALGWDLKIIPMKSTDPGPAIQQAIDEGVDYIASTGLATAQYQAQIDAANAAGIGVLSCFGTDDPSPDGVLMQCGDENFVQKTGPLMADWGIVDSGGTMNVLIVSIPDFPVLKVETDAFIDQLEKNCPDCTYEELNVTLDDLIGGRVPASVVSKVQANSDLNYIFYSFGDLPGGVTSALQTAGLDDQVKQYGQDFSTIDLQEIVDGTMGAWSADPKGYASWLMVDAAARLSLGMTLDEERDASALPTVIVADPDFAQEIIDGNGDWFPPGADEAFKELWGV
jgi:ABC-type sugar transport system substrate-binding protein